MKTETPEVWVIVEILSPIHGKVYKVLAGWYGGYTGSDSWQLSSSMTTLTEEDGVVLFPQISGTLYKCFIMREGTSRLTASIYSSLVDEVNELKDTTIRIVPFEEYKNLMLNQ